MNIKPGDEFNFLVCWEKPYPVIYKRKNGINQKLWFAKFKCRCGIICDINCYSVKSGKTKSCGCYAKDIAGKICRERNIRSFSKNELEYCIKQKMTYKEIANKFNCTISLISLRVNEYNIEKGHELAKFINSKNYNGKLIAKEVVKVKGKYKLLCLCKCGKEITINPTNFVYKKNKSCGCLKPRVNGKLNKTIVSRIRYKAVKRNIIFSITQEYLQNLLDLQENKCAYSKLELTFPKKHNDSDYTASLDRINSSKGYIEGNVQWVHKRVNSMKNDMTEKEFIEFCKLISKNN